MGELGRLATRYVHERTKRGEFRPETARTARSVLFNYTQSVPSDPRRITRKHVQRWLDRLNVSDGTKRMRLSVVKVFHRWLLDQEVTRRDPAAAVKGPKAVRYRARPVADAEVRAVHSHADLRTALCVSLMAQEGLRRGEVARLQVGDVDLENRVLRVDGKGGHRDTTAITDETADLLRLYLKDRHAGPLIRSHVDPTKGVSPQTVYRVVKAAQREAGLDFKPHRLRATGATRVARKSGSPLVVKRYLRHATFSSLPHYTAELEADELLPAMNGTRYRGEVPGQGKLL